MINFGAESVVAEKLIRSVNGFRMKLGETFSLYRFFIPERALARVRSGTRSSLGSCLMVVRITGLFPSIPLQSIRFPYQAANRRFRVSEAHR
jgi:hypothetical protein